MFLVEVKGLSKYYGKVRAVENVSLSVGRGEIFGLLGPNGSGKTTMIKCLTGQLKPTQGEVSVLGLDVLREPVRTRELVGIIPEQENPPSFLTAEEYLHFVASVRKMPNCEAQIKHWLGFLGYQDQKSMLCKDLSRGTRQKLMFTQAFMHKPVLAFIDEPLVNLDPIAQRKIKDFLLGYAKKGNTVIISTHDLDIAGELCDSIGILNKGRLLYRGKPKKDLEKFFLKLVKNAKAK